MDYNVTENKYRLFFNLLISFIFIISVIAFWQPFFDPFGPAQLMVIRIFIPLTIFLYLIINLKNNQISLKINPLFPVLSGYVIVSFVSIFFALNKEISFKYFIEMLLAVYGAYFLYSIIEKKEKLIVLIIVIHTIVSIYGILQHFGMDFFKWNTNFSGRPMGTIGNPDFFAGQLLFALFFLLGFIFFGSGNKIPTVIVFLILILTFLYTKVIGAFIGFFSGFVVFFIIALFLNATIVKNFFKKKLILFIVFCSALIFSIIFLKPAYIKIKNVIIEKKRSVIHRLLMWETSLQMISNSPITGKGIGNYRLYYPFYQAKLINDPANKQYDYVVTWMPHQNYLLIAAETGLPGLLFFLLAIIFFYKISWNLIFIKKSKNPVPIGIISGVTALLVASFFNTFYNIPTTTLYFFFFLFVLNNYYQSNQKYFYIKGDFLKLFTLLILIILIFNLIMDSKTIISNVYLKQANKHAKNKNYNKAIEYYENIIKLKPVELCPQMDVSYYYFAAEAYRETRNFEKAKQYYFKDLEINPYCPEVNNMLGAILGQIGNIEESIKKLEMSIYVAPHYEAAYINLATAYFIKKDYVSVRKVINKFIKLNGETEIFKDMLRQIENL